MAKTKLNIVAEKPVAPADVARYRVLRYIQHGKTLLTPGTLVDMERAKAQHLVNTQALAAHVVETPLTVVADATRKGDAVIADVTPAAVTGAEKATADANAATEGATEDTLNPEGGAR